MRPSGSGKMRSRHRGDAQEGHGQPGLFRQFPLNGGRQGLPQLHQAAGQTPGAQSRLLAPAHQQHLVAPEDHGADAYQGLFRVVAFDTGVFCIRHLMLFRNQLVAQALACSFVTNLGGFKREILRYTQNDK